MNRRDFLITAAVFSVAPTVAVKGRRKLLLEHKAVAVRVINCQTCQCWWPSLLDLSDGDYHLVSDNWGTCVRIHPLIPRGGRTGACKSGILVAFTFKEHSCDHHTPYVLAKPDIWPQCPLSAIILHPNQGEPNASN